MWNYSSCIEVWSETLRSERKTNFWFKSLVEACAKVRLRGVYATGVRSRGKWQTLTKRVAGGQGDFASSQLLDTNVKKIFAKDTRFNLPFVVSRRITRAAPHGVIACLLARLFAANMRIE